MAQFVSEGQDSAVPDSRAAIARPGQAIFAQEKTLFWDVFEGSTLDTSRWTPATASGGTNTQSNGLKIETSTNTAGSAQILSTHVISYLPFAELSVKALMRLTTAPVDQCSREFSLRIDGSNYCSFLNEGTLWVARTYMNGSVFAADVPISIPNASDLTFMDLEFRVTPESVYMIGNGQQVASFSSIGSQSKLQYTGALAQVLFKAINSGSAVNNGIELRSMVASRRFNILPGFVKVKKITADGIVCRGPCWYLGCKRIASTGGTVVIYDNTAASGTVIDEYGAGIGTSHVGITAGAVECTNGIYVDMTTDNLLVYYIA